MKPLYLNGKEPMFIYLDGSGLCVSQKHTSIRRYPLSRVSRVVVSGCVSWSTAALLKCADNGIMVYFLNSEGNLRASWNGKETERTKLSQLWIDFTDRPDWEDIYRIWSRGTRDRVSRISAWRIERHSNSCQMILNALYETPLQNEVNLDELRQLHYRLGGLANSRSRSVLTTASIFLHDEAGAALLSDMIFSIQCGMSPELIAFYDRLKSKNSNELSDLHRAAVNFFEKNRQTANFCVRDFLYRLKRRLREVCYATK